MSKQISIIIPTYKSGNYFQQCLLSLSKQDCSLDLFEVIIILNGKKDPYFNFIQETIKTNGSQLDIKLLYTSKKGVSHARNIGIEKALGRNITFLDDDDFLSSNYISSLYSTMLQQKKSTQNNTIVCSNLKTFNEKEYSEDYISKAFKNCSDKKYSIVRYRKFLSGISGKLIPRDVIDTIRFNTGFSIGEDSIFLFELSKNIHKMVLTDSDVYYVRRIREGSALSIRRSFKERVLIYLNLSKTYSKIFFESPFKYNFILFLTRMLAAFKQFISAIFYTK